METASSQRSHLLGGFSAAVAIYHGLLPQDWAGGRAGLQTQC